MRKFYTLLSREVSSYFYSPIAYIVLFFFLFVSGADFYFQISFMVKIVWPAAEKIECQIQNDGRNQGDE